MKTEAFSTMKNGTGLSLKPYRADDYGISRGQPVFFYRIEPRQNYSVPWVVALSPGGLGYYKPSDFMGLSGTSL